METAGCAQQAAETVPLRLVDPLVDKEDWRVDDFYPREPHAAIMAVGDPEPIWRTLLPGVMQALMWIAFGAFVATGLALGLVAITRMISGLLAPA